MKKIYASFCLLVIAFSTDSNAQCHYIPATSTAVDTVTWNFAGGAFQSFGCAPIDPTYWMNNTSCNVTATFVMPQNYPGIRVWGMNDDDSAAVYV
ncbi:MAG TPA: hypothetical protein VL651_00245, partial [Bacteroidia bacterium]|nr:hypothetical protein [Bacteroidia bacterium]